MWACGRVGVWACGRVGWGRGGVGGQLLELGYFHADPHPGNLMVDHEGRLTLIDFGLCATVPLPDTKRLTIALVLSRRPPSICAQCHGS